MNLCQSCGRELNVEKFGLHDGSACRRIGRQLPEEVHQLRTENARLRAEPELIGRKYTVLLGEKLEQEDKLRAALLQVEELKKQKDSCVPMDLTFYGYSKVMVTPPPTDEMSIQGVKCLRVVLTPQKPSCEVKLAGGREIHIDGWANKVQLDFDTPFCPHDAIAKKVQEEFEESCRLNRELEKKAEKLGRAPTWHLSADNCNRKALEDFMERYCIWYNDVIPEVNRKCEIDPGDELHCLTHDCSASIQCEKPECPHCTKAH